MITYNLDSWTVSIDWGKFYVYNVCLPQSLLYSKLTHPMNLNTASAISAVVGVPLASVPVGLAIHSTLESLRPKSKLKKWSIRVEHISTVVVSKADMLTSEEMEKFLTVLIR